MDASQILGNQALAEAGRDERLDCRSYRDQGIEKIPQIHLGRKAHRMMQRGTQSDRVDRYLDIERARVEHAARLQRERLRRTKSF